MLFKDTYRRAKCHRLRKKVNSPSESEFSSTHSSPTTSSENERRSQYLEFSQIKSIQDELDYLTFHINALKKDIAVLAETENRQYEMAFKEAIASAFDQERFELNEREFNEPYKK